ncbi:MAG: hypothetical protein LC798_13185 [Chloroflexi bacterium]|nr:hypothetical protein [Chloroflexota bacterium]
MRFFLIGVAAGVGVQLALAGADVREFSTDWWNWFLAGMCLLVIVIALITWKRGLG